MNKTQPVKGRWRGKAWRLHPTQNVKSKNNRPRAEGLCPEAELNLKTWKERIFKI